MDDSDTQADPTNRAGPRDWPDDQVVDDDQADQGVEFDDGHPAIARTLLIHDARLPAWPLCVQAARHLLGVRDGSGQRVRSETADSQDPHRLGARRAPAGRQVDRTLPRLADGTRREVGLLPAVDGV